MYPYDNGTAFDDPDEFDPGELLIRQNKLRHLFSVVANRQNIAIFGLPKIGKTYLLKCLSSRKIQLRFERESRQDLKNLNKCIFVYIDLELYLQKTFVGFFETLNRHIIKQSRGRLELTYNAGIGEDGFSDILDQIHAQHFHLVLLMDMFDEIVKNKQIHDILAFLRAHATTGKVSYVTASIAPLYEICNRSIVDSPFFNIFENYPLEVLAHEEALELISIPAQKAGVPFSEVEVVWILIKTGRHPFFIQSVCHVLFDDKLQSGNGELDEKRLKKLAYPAYNDLLPHFTDIWKRLSDAQRTSLQDEVQQKDNQLRQLPELSESALFRQFVRNTCQIELFKMTKKELEIALDKMNDLVALGETNLRLLKIISQRLKKGVVPSSIERGRRIREVLNEAYEQLRGTVIRNDLDPTLRNYNILYYRYFKYQLKNEQIAARLGISARQYFRYRNKAIEALRNILFEMENAASLDE